MELKNQILLVILIPIILILLLAVLQVGLLGFVSIPSFQDSLMEFHISRHLADLKIEMNILQQEIYIQYQAYLNQILGVGAHLRFYCFGEFQNYSTWSLDDYELSPYSFTSGKIMSEEYHVAWSHKNYSELNSLQTQNQQLSFMLNKITQSLILSDLVINNTRSLSEDLGLNDTTSSDSDQVPINYSQLLVICTNSLIVRYPQFTEAQQKLLKNYNTQAWYPSQMKLDSTLNFTLSYDKDDLLNSEPGISLQQIVQDDGEHQCYLTTTVLNSYLADLTERHYQSHYSQGEYEHQLFTALVKDNYTTMTPTIYSKVNITESIIQYIVDSKQLSNSTKSTLTNQMSPLILSQIGSLTKNTNINETSMAYSFGGFTFNLLFHKIILYSTKEVSAVTAQENGRRYVYIEPEVNDFQINTFILVHYFEESVLISELYNGTSLSNVKTLEIIVFIVIIVLSVSKIFFYLVIFIFVWYTATRIGISFEQPIQVLTDFMNSIDIQNMDQGEELIDYEDYFNSFEIKSLFQTMNIFITTIKYSNQKYSNSLHSDAIALMELSKAKDFYKKEIGNMSAVGICANNIGILHMKDGRIFEAVNEMEEAIYIAKLELMEIKELKKWCLNMKAALQEPNLYQNFKQKLKFLAEKFRNQMKINWNGVQIKGQKEKRGKNSVPKLNSQTLIKKDTQTRVQSTTQVGSKSLVPHIALMSNTGTQGNITQSRPTQIQSLAAVNTPNTIRRKSEKVSLMDNMNGLTPINQVDGENSALCSPQLSPNMTANRMKYYGSHSYNQSSIIQSQRVDLKESIIERDDKNEQRDRGDSAESSSGAVSELQMIEEKLQELAKKKQLAKAKLLNRQFQLAQFMFNICMQYSDVFIPETLKFFQDFEGTAEKEQKFTQSDIVRLINLNVKKALCYIQIGDIDNFKLAEQKAEEYFNKLVTGEKEERKEQEDFNFVDMFKNVPKEVLQSKITQLKAIYQIIQGNFQNAAELLTEIIEQGEYYDPEVRDFCLVVLENIFKMFGISTLPILQYRNKIEINVYEIVFLIDYSQVMTLEQINLSHKICTRIFGILQPQDFIGMYGFNNCLHEAFPLQPKGTYKDLLTKQLSMAITSPGGNQKLYQALKFSIKNFFEHKINISKVNKDTGKLKLIQFKTQIKSSLPSVAEVEEQVNLTSQNLDISATVQNNYEPSSDTESGDEDFKFFRNGTTVEQSTDQKEQQNDFRSRYKFICIFTDINEQLKAQQMETLSQLLKKNQVDVMVFNIANENHNMLELKKLSKITSRSHFVNATANLEKLFGKSRQTKLQKKMYLEFF